MITSNTFVHRSKAPQFVKLIVALCFVIFLLVSNSLLAQQNFLKQLDNTLEQYQIDNLQEKVFLHTDRDAYVAGELIWFKIYTISAENKLLDLSKVAYVEVISRENKVVLHAKIALNNGQGNGSFYLPVSLESGNYQLRAYTNWMRNQSPDFFFQKQLSILNTLVGNVSIKATTKNYDLQFFPEGGQLIAGMENRLAFKVVDGSGKGMKSTGVLVNQKGDTLQTLSDHQFGMGSVLISPSVGQKYIAKLSVEDQIIEKELPKAVREGYLLQVKNSGDALLCKVASTFNESELFLFIHKNGFNTKKYALSLKNKRASQEINLSELGEGINHITLFNSEGKAVAERLYFKFPKDEKGINYTLAENSFPKRSQVTLSFNNLTNGNAYTSLAVFMDDSLQSLNQQTDIRSWLWLSSDLKGKIEHPDYYFSAPKEQAKKAVDILMLTQGWRKFQWNEVLQPNSSEKQYLPELEGLLLQGKVVDTETGSTNKGASSYLAFPDEYLRFYASRSNAEGHVNFVIPGIYGNQKAYVKTFTDEDSTWTFNMNSPYSKEYTTENISPLSLESSFQQVLEARSVSMQSQNIYLDENIQQFTQIVIDTVPFYGNPDNYYVLNDYTRFPTMEEVMREYVPNVFVKKIKNTYRFKVFDKLNDVPFNVDPLLLLNGLPLKDVNQVMAMDPFKIKSLEVVARRFILNKHTFSGIVNYKSYESEYTWEMADGNDLIFDFEGLQKQRIFYQPNYENEDARNSRIPDFRTLLNWVPTLNLKEGEQKEVNFYSSDKEGKFIGILQGITEDGRPIVQTFKFEVNGN